jgi:phenylalanyl-tRNA synthetase beta chain
LKILSSWLREFLPSLVVDDRQLAEDLTLRGIAVEGVHAVEGGHLFEMDITTNRVDAMNHYGVAREAAAIYGIPLMRLEEDCATSQVEEGYPVSIEAVDLCGRFTAQVVRGVKVDAAIGLMAERFTQLGQKSISNVVDVTNYTWLAMGHPTHAFDLDTLEGAIVVRRAKAGEKLRLLDGSEKVLVADDLVVADEKKALALAGVMGGWDSRVTENTKNVLVEAAWFDQAAIRASSKRHGLHTDASHRFERGADFAAAPVANRYVTKKLVAWCGGTVDGPMTDVVVPKIEARTAKRKHVTLRVETVQRLLGTTLEGGSVSADVIEQYLEALGCGLRPAIEVGTYEVALPSWRLDLEREIDLVEEIARVYGYNRFADTLPAFSGGVKALPHAAQEQALRETLRGMGWNEVIGSTFCAEEDAKIFSRNAAVPMGNPLSAEAGVLRPSLLPGAVTMLAGNQNRDVEEARVFEIGAAFTGTVLEVQEQNSLVLAAYGGVGATPTIAASDALFYEMKGAVEALIRIFAAEGAAFVPDALPGWIEPSRGARVLLGGTDLGAFGELRTEIAEVHKLRQNLVLGELDAAALMRLALRTQIVKDPSRFQAVERDFSFVFENAVMWQQIENAVRGLAIPELVRLEPREIFRDAKGKAVEAGKYSLLLRIVLQAQNRTLREDEVTTAVSQVTSVLEDIGGRQRA